MLRRGRGYRDHEYLPLKAKRAAATRQRRQAAWNLTTLHILVKTGKPKLPIISVSAPHYSAGRRLHQIGAERINVGLPIEEGMTIDTARLELDGSVKTCVDAIGRPASAGLVSLFALSLIAAPQQTTKAGQR